MACIKALSAWRYDFTLAGQPNTLITPPYDVIDAVGQESYYAANPYNVIRLEWGKTYADDNDQNNRYTRAAADFAAWREMGILKRDAEPSLYPYVQEFTMFGETWRRSGFLATVKAGGYEDGMVLPHEETLPGHKEDRHRLMQACMANFSPIFALYAEQNRETSDALSRAAAKTEPIFDAVDEAGVHHIVWRVSDAALIAQVESTMAAHKIYIADGHHRYETASRFAAEAAAAGQKGCDRMLVNLVNLYDPGLLVLPTHRLVKNLEHFSAAAFLHSLGDAGFAVFSMPNLEALQDNMNDMPQDMAGFGLYMEGEYHLLNIERNDMIIAATQPGYSSAYQRLDVSIAHALILEALCGIGKEEMAAGKNLSYCREAADGVDMVDKGGYHFALLMNSTRIFELMAVANAGEKMPQKSTYFYPKVIAGLVINQIKAESI
ncbi:MAG: DUF1015 domain-containing protein [Clostridiales bacterium]|nr:DUF1015 domain-containing protein [Clostridiales bacterium]